MFMTGICHLCTQYDLTLEAIIISQGSRDQYRGEHDTTGIPKALEEQ
jgi:hypothetical protein